MKDSSVPTSNTPKTETTTLAQQMKKFQKSGSLTMWTENGVPKMLFEWDDYSGEKSKHFKMPITADYFTAKK